MDDDFDSIYNYIKTRPPSTCKILGISTPYRENNWVKKFFLEKDKNMNLTELSKTIRFDNASKGFDPTEGGIDRYLLLAISEICEAQEELRDGRRVNEIYYEEQITLQDDNDPYNPDKCKSIKKPCGFPVEIADAIIRLLDICGKFGIQVIFSEDTSWRFTESIDYYLLRACNLITECQLGYFAGIMTYKFTGNLVTTIELLYHLSIYHNIDIMKVIDEKLAYNRSRPAKHGRKF